LVDTANGVTLITLSSPSAVRALAFSPDGQRLAAATDGGLTQIWSTPPAAGEAQARGLATPSGPTQPGGDVGLSTDGKWVATASRDGTAKLWDASTGQLLLTLAGSGRGLNGLAFSPDGARLITSGDDGLRAYLLRIEDLVALAHTRVTRPLTQAECQPYLHQDC